MTKKLGFGLMRLPLKDADDAKSVDIEHFKKMVDAFLERGFTYFDTAWMYCGFESENAVKDALTSRHPRDSYTLTTKLHGGFLKSKEDRDRIFFEQMKKTGVEYFDYYLLHAVNERLFGVYEQYDCYEWLKEKKRQGLVKHIGLSFHDTAETLDKVLSKWPEMELVQLQINYLDWDSEGVQSRKCYEVARKHKKPVIVMEPVKGGALANVPKEVETLFKNHNPNASVPSWAVRFCAGLDGVMMVLSGMSNMQQLLDNTGYMSAFTPLNSAEQDVVKKAVEILLKSDAVPCTGCAYCVDGCPKKIPIPKYFSLYNADKRESGKKGWTTEKSMYETLAEQLGKASDCIGCGACQKACPQKLPIIRYLREVAMYFETE